MWNFTPEKRSLFPVVNKNKVYMFYLFVNVEIAKIWPSLYAHTFGIATQYNDFMGTHEDLTMTCVEKDKFTDLIATPWPCVCICIYIYTVCIYIYTQYIYIHIYIYMHCIYIYISCIYPVYIYIYTLYIYCIYVYIWIYIYI